MITVVDYLREREQRWDWFERTHLPPQSELIAISKADADRRCYRVGESFLKAVRTGPQTDPATALRDEAELNDRTGRNAELGESVKTSQDCWATLVFPWIAGRALTPADSSLGVAYRIAREVARVNRRGVVHRDLNLGNLILRPDSEVELVDFGHAKRMAPVRAIAGDFLGWPRDTYKGNSLRHTFRRLYFQRTERGPRRRRGTTSANLIDHLTDRGLDGLLGHQLVALERAWTRLHPSLPAYGFSAGPTVLRAQSSYLMLWRLLAPEMGLQGKRILEIGDTAGLVAASALAEGAVRATTMTTERCEAGVSSLHRCLGAPSAGTAVGVRTDSHEWDVVVASGNTAVHTLLGALREGRIGAGKVLVVHRSSVSAIPGLRPVVDALGEPSSVVTGQGLAIVGFDLRRLSLRDA